MPKSYFSTESMTSRWLLLKAGVQREDEPAFRLLDEDWRNLASILTSFCSRTVGKMLLCFTAQFAIYRTAILYHPLCCKETVKHSDNMETRAREAPSSQREPEALHVSINWNDDDDLRNPHFNTKTHHMFYFNISLYLILSLTLSVTSNLSANMTDLFSAFSPSACALFFLIWVVLSNILTLKSVGLSTTLGSSSLHLSTLLFYSQ